MKIILITRDRPELTRQTIETMEANAANLNKHRLVVVWDGPEEELPYFGYFHTGKQLGVGGAKNFGVKIHEDFEQLEPDDLLMFTDNDMYYLKDWDYRLEEMMDDYPDGSPCPIQLGGWKHPYHLPSPLGISIGFGYNNNRAYEVDAVTGNCFVIRYKDWLKYGPFDANALGPGQSEDFALSQKIKADGGVVATLDPPIAIHCGLRNSIGEPAVGWLEMSIMAEKQIRDNKIEDIYLEVPEDGTVRIQPKAVGGPFSGLNVGSGQRRFESSLGWINVDHCSRPPDQVPDVVCDGTELVAKFGLASQDMVVLHHVLEHFGCGEADTVVRQCWDVLRPGGSLLIFVPDLQKLSSRWLGGEIDTFTFCVNIYGAYMSEEGDRHKWGYVKQTLKETLENIGVWSEIKPFNWRLIPGADIAQDWWILGIEAVK